MRIAGLQSAAAATDLLVGDPVVAFHVTFQADAGEDCGAALDAWSQCVMKKVYEFDDGRAEASFVARSALDACQRYAVGFADSELEIVLELVLKKRARERADAKAVSPGMFSRAWQECSGRHLADAYVPTIPIVTLAADTARRCRSLHEVPAGMDVEIIAGVAQRISGTVLAPGSSRPTEVRRS